MLPYNNTGKYHETPEGIPMLQTIDHSLTETMFSLSPSSQFMYEPEGLEPMNCGQSQGFAGPPVREITPGDECVKSEGIISPSMEGMTFQDCVELDGLFGPSATGLGFKDCFELDGNFAPSVSGISFEGTEDKPDGMFCMPGDGLDFDDDGRGKARQLYGTPNEGVSFADGRKASGGGFDVLSEGLSFENCGKLDELIPATTTSDAEALERLTDDWFTENDIFEMPKESNELMQDAVFGGGPTLTQLNSKDLDSAFLDEYRILEDLYSSSAAFAGAGPSAVAAAATSLEPVQTASPKFLPGAPGIGSATSPKFTTCTVTSYVTTVSASGGAAPLRFPTFVTNELFASGGPETRFLGSSPTAERKPDIEVLDRLAELIASGAPIGASSTYANQCYVPMLTGGTQAVRLVGTVVMPAVSVVVSEEAPKPALVLPDPSTDEGKPTKRTLEQSWDVERYVQPAESRAMASAGSAECSQGQKSRDVAFNPSEELSDREESMLEDSDIENAMFDNSDGESVISKSEHADDFTATSRKEKKYFWQYNTQSKGPKGKRLCKSVETEDPHVLHDFEDPVFDPEQNQTRYKHNGKARRGDGNDVTPNPHKLYVTGNELKKLNKLINDITPSSDMPASARGKMLKEKNKFASRACRLKKKAQHEANKLKLHGLEHEHRQLMKVLNTIKREIHHRVNGRKDGGGLREESLSYKLESLVQQNISMNVAGHTADYVNLVLQKVAKGDRTGGITVDD